MICLRRYRFKSSTSSVALLLQLDMMHTRHCADDLWCDGEGPRTWTARSMSSAAPDVLAAFAWCCLKLCMASRLVLMSVNIDSSLLVNWYLRGWCSNLLLSVCCGAVWCWLAVPVSGHENAQCSAT